MSAPSSAPPTPKPSAASSPPGTPARAVSLSQEQLCLAAPPESSVYNSNFANISFRGAGEDVTRVYARGAVLLELAPLEGAPRQFVPYFRQLVAKRADGSHVVIYEPALLATTLGIEQGHIVLTNIAVAQFLLEAEQRARMQDRNDDWACTLLKAFDWRVADNSSQVRGPNGQPLYCTRWQLLRSTTVLPDGR